MDRMKKLKSRSISSDSRYQTSLRLRVQPVQALTPVKVVQPLIMLEIWQLTDFRYDGPCSSKQGQDWAVSRFYHQVKWRKPCSESWRQCWFPCPISYLWCSQSICWMCRIGPYGERFDWTECSLAEWNQWSPSTIRLQLPSTRRRWDSEHSNHFQPVQ